MAVRESESLYLYEPLPEQARFHQSKAQHRLLRGSNRGGKTLPSAIEVARAFSGQDPHGKYPREDGRIYAVGKDLKHCGEVMYRKLFRRRPFMVIRDLVTDRWRAWRPNDPEDWKRKPEAKPAPPLIPRRYVKSISWLDKKASVPKIVTAVNGWEISFFSGEGKPPQGGDIDLAWLDEEIPDPDWLPELQARILDRAGKIVWSATPQAGTEHLYDLHDRAEEEAGEDNPSVEEFVILLGDNAFMADADKRAFAKNQKTEDEYKVRILGEFAIASDKVFPEWGDRLMVDWFPIPPDWSRYAFVDPGRQRCAALFVAVPPPDHADGRHVYVYDELYLKDADKEKFADGMRDRLGEHTAVAFVIDSHESKKHDASTGLTLRQQYASALKARKVRSLNTGSDFIAAGDNVKAGVEAFRGWLNADAAGITRLRVLRGKCPNLDWEMRRYRYKRIRSPYGGYLVTDDPVKRNDHLCDCARYAADYDPRWVRPRKPKKAGSAAVRALAEKRKRQRGRQGRSFINLGPGKE